MPSQCSPRRSQCSATNAPGGTNRAIPIAELVARWGTFSRRRIKRGRLIGLVVAAFCFAGRAEAGRPFAIEVVDASTGRGVPLIELRTVNEIRFVTDSAGLVAFDEPGLIGRPVFFHVRGHGYEYPVDGFGFRGTRLDVVSGGCARVEVRRINIAERLYRATGQGIFRDSVLLGRPVPVREPLLNGHVMGQDSVLEATFRGRIHWFWGDTNRPSYPLGTFGTPGATSKLPGDGGGLDPELGVDYEYNLAPDGFVAPAADLVGDGPTWLDALTVLRDPNQAGSERMFAAFAKVRPSMDAYRRGIAEYDPKAKRFREVAAIPLDAPIRPFGHPFPLDMAGTSYIVFADPYPLVRVRADVDHFTGLRSYEAFTCLLPGSSKNGEALVDRGEDGLARYRWRIDAPPVDAEWQERLIASGKLGRDEAMLALQDVDSGRGVTLARGSTYWNPYRNRWLMIATEVGGTSSNLGEVWFAEADSPLGPWTYARKVVTHDRYSFYNPKQHPAFNKRNGRDLFFEGTYTTTFSSNSDPTSRYDYNQIMYNLNLEDPRLNLPRPVYEVSGRYQFGPSLGRRPAFFALDRPGKGTVAVGLFHALASDLANPPATTIPLHEAGKANPDSSPRYGLEEHSGELVGRVWRNPSRFVVAE